MPATGGEGGGHLYKGRLCPSHDKKRVRASIAELGLGEVICRNSTVISNRRLQLVISGLTSAILVVLGTVNLQFRAALVPFSFQSVLGIVAAQVLGTVWSSCS